MAEPDLTTDLTTKTATKTTTKTTTGPGAVTGPVAASGVRRLRRRTIIRPPSEARQPQRHPDHAVDSRVRRAAGRVLGGGDRGRQSDDLSSPAVRWTPDADQLGLIATLIDAGLPLAEAVATLAEVESDRTSRAAFVRLEREVRAGGALGSSLTRLGAASHVQMLVDGGERTGRLTEALRSAGTLTARVETLRGEVRRALVYPAVVLLIGLAILTVIAIAVVPPLERTFTDLGGELPRATRIVLAVSRPLSSPSSLGVLAVAVGGIALVRRRSTSAVRKQLSGRIAPPWWPSVAPLLQRALDHAPLTGRLRREMRLTVVAHVMATLVRGGVPLDAALQHVADGLPPSAARQALQAAAATTRQGSSPFEGRGIEDLLDTVERGMLRVGERNGVLADQWERIARRRDLALEDRMRRLGVVIEPVLVALVGVVVGGAVLALYLPTFRVMDLL